jgi:hypothetical protein
VADYFTHFAFAVRLQGKLAAAWVTDELRRRERERHEHLDAGDDDAAEAVGCEFEWNVDDGCLYISDDGASGNVQHVARFVQELIKLGYVLGPVAVQWADTCSKSRADAFTGGGVVITKTRMRWFVVPLLIEKQIDAIRRRQQRA